MAVVVVVEVAVHVLHRQGADDVRPAPRSMTTRISGTDRLSTGRLQRRG
ncbi:MAG: hypothetical protein R6U10_05735 [Thermoplasmatota archaeon]